MPNKLQRDKNNRRGSRREVARIRPGADSVKSLLARSSPVLAQVADQAARQRLWRKWLDDRVAEPLRARITGVVERDGELVIFTESAGWGVRLRYAMAELESELRLAHPEISRVLVRVLPGDRAR
jgi:hypothetical protein